MGKVIYPRKGEVHTAPVTWPAVFADATWAQVIEACQTNAVPATWEVGDQKTMIINGTDYLIDIIGKNHDTYTAGGTAPLTFQMHDCYGTAYTRNSGDHSNSGGWKNTLMRNTRVPSFLKLMPSEVQSGIKEVNKLTSAGNQSSVINTTTDKLFLLSEIEALGKTTYSFAGEGSQYAYYSAGNRAVKKANNTSVNWWLRSPYTSTALHFANVSSTGAVTVNGSANSLYLSFAFCF